MLVERLSVQSGLTVERIRRLAATASKRYKVYTIPKRGGGERTIEQPSSTIKEMQRWLVAAVVEKLPVSDFAAAYRPGRGIRENALAHLGTNFTLRVDFENFFPSFSGNNIRAFLSSPPMGELNLNEDDIDFMVNVVTRNDALTIGAPSSPSLTNALMKSFDDYVVRRIKKGIVYSRYADDLFFSTKEAGVLADCIGIVRAAADEFSYGKLVINSRKTTFLSRKYRRKITGLVLTPEGKISIGRERKREIRTLIYMRVCGELSEERAGYLEGWISYIRGVDPDFHVSLVAKYGDDLKGGTLTK